MKVNWVQAAFYTLWVTGGGLLLITWLTWTVQAMQNRRRQRLLFSSDKKPQSIKNVPFIKTLSEEMEIAEMKLPVEAIIAMMLAIAAMGWFAVDAGVAGMRENVALDADRILPSGTSVVSGFLALLLGSLPYFYAKFRLQQKRHRIALDMIKLVQNVIGHYSAGRTVQDMIARSSATMPDHVRSEWRHLELQSHLSSSLEDALYDFARRTDNAWAEDLADILLINHKYGNDVIDALHKLVVDMQTARKNEERRLAMVTAYRIGTLLMIGFSFFIVIFNVYADGANFRHYFVRPGGKLAIMLSSAVMFASLVMVVRSGRRTF